jgi:hypothetical protein
MVQIGWRVKNVSLVAKGRPVGAGMGTLKDGHLRQVFA